MRRSITLGLLLAGLAAFPASTGAATTPRRVGAAMAPAASVPRARAAAPHSRAAPPAPLPLGARHMPELRTTRVVARGVRLTQIVRGRPPSGPQWAVDVGFAPSRAEAQATVARLRAQGYPARVRRVDAHVPGAPGSGPVGFSVRAQRYATKAEAQAVAMRLQAMGEQAVSVDDVGEDPTSNRGPWRIRVLDVDPRRFRGSVRAVLSNGIVPGRETVTSLDRRVGAFAGVNAGYFVVGPADGTPGDLAGISVVGGRLVSEAVRGRTALLLRDERGGRRGRQGARHGAAARRHRGELARVRPLSTRIAAHASDGAGRLVDGRNRAPGLIRSCGGSGGDSPTQRPRHDVSCTDPSELIQFTRAFGTTTAAAQPAAEVEAVLDRHGRVTAVRAPGGAIPRRGSVLAGTGDAAAWLRAHARPGARVQVTVRVRSGRTPLRLTRGLDVVNGGPRLLRAGKRDITAFAEGFTHPGDPSFYVSFGVRRNPRTMAGVTRRGHLLLVAADGHAPGYAVGLTFPEEARVMRALGARDALNLDGGGSTTMALGTRLLTRPSDDTGERPIGDAIALTRR